MDYANASSPAAVASPAAASSTDEPREKVRQNFTTHERALAVLNWSCYCCIQKKKRDDGDTEEADGAKKQKTEKTKKEKKEKKEKKDKKEKKAKKAKNDD